MRPNCCTDPSRPICHQSTAERLGEDAGTNTVCVAQREPLRYTSVFMRASNTPILAVVPSCGARFGGEGSLLAHTFVVLGNATLTVSISEPTGPVMVERPRYPIAGEVLVSLPL